MSKKCVLLLSSYDGGSDLWDGFFKTLRAEWPNFNLPVVLNTESKNYKFQGFDITSIHANNAASIPWSKRLRLVLEEIDSEYILFFLEDYWLDDKVDVDFFYQVLDWLDHNKDIATFCFYPLPGNNKCDNQFERFELRPKYARYKLTCQVALWRKEKLIRLLKDCEDPWEFEMAGSLRAAKCKDRFYSIGINEKKVFSYGDPQIGCMIHRGKWNESEVRRYSSKYHLNIDTSKRGVEDWNSIYKERENPSESVLDKLKRPHRIARIYNRILAYFEKQGGKRI